MKEYTNKEALHIVIDSLDNTECKEMVEFLRNKDIITFILNPNDFDSDRWFLEQSEQAQRNIFNSAIVMAHQNHLHDFLDNTVDFKETDMKYLD